MCGIVGVAAFTEKGTRKLNRISEALVLLKQRGPDDEGVYYHKHVGLGHTRLSVIDKSKKASQPMSAKNGRYTIVFNGEFYNYREEKKALLSNNVRFISESDTEVLLRLFIKEGKECLKKINGCFSLAIYDKVEDSLFIARDRMGIKPLYWYKDDDKFLFASEMKAIIALGVPKIIDKASVFTYLQLNYIPAPNSVFLNVNKLLPGHCISIRAIHSSAPKMKIEKYYEIPFAPENVIQPTPHSYLAAQKKLEELMFRAVERRLVADVPLGVFLSGGIDSSVVAAIARELKPDLQTFSVGYKDHSFFDETDYAKNVAGKIGSKHKVFKLTNSDMYKQLAQMLDYCDEPFADSSALVMNILSSRTREHVTVALSGDGADELFGGYNKHFAEWKARNPGMAELLLKSSAPVFSMFSGSRSTRLGNLIRQLKRFSEGLNMNYRERYWKWASIADEQEANYLLSEQLSFSKQRLSEDAYEYKKRKKTFLNYLRKDGDLNDVLLTDMHLILPNDMLYKVDLMSMAHSLEVRTPFLDHELVNFAFGLPHGFKVNGSLKKKILQDTFRDRLPEQLYNRQKKGFEIPLLQWMRSDLKSQIGELLNHDLLKEQGLFNPDGIRALTAKLYSKKPGDSPATVWALMVFQKWWLKYFPNLPC